MIDVLIKIAIPITIAIIVFDAALLFGFSANCVNTANVENSIDAEDKPLISDEDQRMIDEYGSVGIDVGDDRILIITKDDENNEQ